MRGLWRGSLVIALVLGSTACVADSDPTGAGAPGAGGKADGEDDPISGASTEEDQGEKPEKYEDEYSSGEYYEEFPDEIVFLAEVPELPEELVIESEGASGDAALLVARLAELRDANVYDFLSIGLGFTATLPFDQNEPLIRWSRNELYLTSIHVNDDTCGRSCGGATGSAMTDCVAPGLEEARDAPENVRDEKAGICSIISTAHGVVRLGLASTDWTGVVNGRNWDDDYIQRVWTAAGRMRNARGTRQAYMVEWNQRYYARESYSLTAPEPGRFFDFSLKDWCQALGKYANTSGNWDSCHLGTFGPGNGHDMLVLSASWNSDDEVCEVRTVNSGIQGNPHGVNVPRNPGEQDWRISGARPWDDLKVCIAGDCADAPRDRRGFWGRLGFNRVNFACYDEEPRFYVFNQPPDEKGSHWN